MMALGEPRIGSPKKRKETIFSITHESGARRSETTPIEKKELIDEDLRKDRKDTRAASQ
jgi:hypothetical protein